MPNDNLFQNRLKELRKDNRNTQGEISQMLGISRSTYTGYELGTINPPRIMLQKLANYFRVSVDYLLGNTSQKSRFEKFNDEVDLEKLRYDIEEAEKNPTDFIIHPDDLAVEKEELQRSKDEFALTQKDERDITKNLNDIMGKIRSGEDAPLRYEGEEIDEESLNLLESAINMTLRQLKRENKEKYNPYKNKR